METNKKILGLAVTLLTITMLASPAMAIGPQKAVKNPNIIFDFGWAQFMLPSGQFTEWVQPTVLGTIFFQHKNANDFQIRNAMPMTIQIATSPDSQGVADMIAFYGAENHWIYLSQDSYANFLFNSFVQTLGPVAAGAIAAEISSMYPYGLYIRFVVIGN